MDKSLLKYRKVILKFLSYNCILIKKHIFIINEIYIILIIA